MCLRLLTSYHVRVLEIYKHSELEERKSVRNLTVPVRMFHPEGK